MLVAFITGITGQDGSYLAELLLEKSYVVYGLIRRSSSVDVSVGRLAGIINHPNLILKYGDMTDSSSFANIIETIRSTHRNMTRLEVYNLAAQSHVHISFMSSEYTSEVDAIGTLKLLNAIMTSGLMHLTRFYQASTSELFGNITNTCAQNELTPLKPESPYAISKLFSHNMCNLYRDCYLMYTVSNFLFNHSSKRQNGEFILRKIVLGLNDILNGTASKLELGNLNSYRDIGHAKDYMCAVYLTMQQNTPDNYVIATGETHSVREIVQRVFAYAGYSILWKGQGVDEIGYDSNTGKDLIFVNKDLFRPSDVTFLLGDPSKITTTLGWTPSISFEQLIEEMVYHDIPQLLHMNTI